MPASCCIEIAAGGESGERNSYLRNGGTMKRNKSVILAFTIPGTLLFLLTFVYPIIRTVIMSLLLHHGNHGSGIQMGFQRNPKLYGIISEQSVPDVFYGIFFRIWLYGGIIIMAVSPTLATILTSGVRGKGFSRPRFISPNVISAVAMAT